MKVVVQSLTTYRFLDQVQQWTEDVQRARSFEDSHRAMEFCLRHGLADCQVVLKFADGEYDIALPVEGSAMPLNA